MNVSALLRVLFFGAFLRFGVVADEGGGAAADDDGQAGDDAAATEQADDAQGDDQAQAAAAGDDAAQGEAATEDDDAELVVTLGDEPAEEDQLALDQPGDSSVISGLRKRLRETAPALRARERELKALREQVERLSGGAQAPADIVLGEEPTLEGCDFDGPKFKAELESWLDRKRQIDERRKSKEEAEAKQRQQWQGRIEAVTKAAATLKVQDADTAQEVFETTFSMVQQGIIIGGLDDPKTSALMRYALGRNPAKAKQLAAISDPVKFAIAVGKLEDKMKVQPRKAAPPPEGALPTSGAGSAIAANSSLDKLREKARQSGDYTEYYAAKNRAAGRQRQAA